MRGPMVRQTSSFTNQQVLVANKIDMIAERQVTTEEGQKLADTYGIPYVETSAKLRTNIDEVFFEVVREIRKCSVK